MVFKRATTATHPKDWTAGGTRAATEVAAGGMMEVAAEAAGANT